MRTVQIQYSGLEHGMIVVRRNKHLTEFLLRYKAITAFLYRMVIESYSLMMYLQLQQL
jgi:hypothetical protein